MRTSGILLPVSALPGPYGIGMLGAAARRFVDFLQKAGQTVWQILPLGQTGFGDSPYQTASAFAGSLYLIDLDELVDDGLLTASELPPRGAEDGRTDYAALFENRFALLEKAARRGWERDAESVARFCADNADWLGDYALYMACKRRFGMVSWTEWPEEDIRMHRPEAVARYKKELAEDVRLFVYGQYLFFRQWDALRKYAHGRGISVMGDLPIYLPLDSAELWAGNGDFQLDEQRRPTCVAGVPPDYFSEDGQLWGNPIYDWRAMRRDGFAWWRRRMQAAARLYDIVRLDHFRALGSYWAVPPEETTAVNGRWRRGPRRAFVRAMRSAVPDTLIVVEDLGMLTGDVHRLRRYAGWPGMKVLQFAFDDPAHPSTYLPHLYEENCVCYTGTHDNATLAQWLAEADEGRRVYIRSYFGLTPEDDLSRALLRGGLSSRAMLFICPVQDWLGLGAEARINVPGTVSGGNWSWRLSPGMLTDALAEEIAAETRRAGR